MHKKLSRLMQPNLAPYFLCLVLFILATARDLPWVAAAEGAALAALLILYQRQSRQRRRRVARFIDDLTGGTDSVSRNSMLRTPLPVAVIRVEDGEIIWANEGFAVLSGLDDEILDTPLADLIPNLDLRRLAESGSAGVPVELNGHSCQVYSAAGRTEERAVQEAVVTAYFVDVTEARELKALYDASRPVVSIFVLDNYEELMKAGGDAAKSAIQAQIDERLNAWVTGSGGLLRKYNRDRYFLICDAQCWTPCARWSARTVSTPLSPSARAGSATATRSPSAGRRSPLRWPSAGAATRPWSRTGWISSSTAGGPSPRRSGPR